MEWSRQETPPSVETEMGRNNWGTERKWRGEGLRFDDRNKKHTQSIHQREDNGAILTKWVTRTVGSYLFSVYWTTPQAAQDATQIGRMVKSAVVLCMARNFVTDIAIQMSRPKLTDNSTLEFVWKNWETPRKLWNKVSLSPIECDGLLWTRWWTFGVHKMRSAALSHAVRSESRTPLPRPRWPDALRRRRRHQSSRLSLTCALIASLWAVNSWQ